MQSRHFLNTKPKTEPITKPLLMKKFRTILAAFLLLFIATPVLQSCLDDWDDDEHPLLAIGTVRIIDGKDYYFALDEGTKMFPGDTAQVDNYTLVEGQRAFT